MLLALLALLGVLVISSTKAQTSSIQGIQPGWPIDNQGNILITDEVADRLAETGAKYVRINFRLGPYPYDTNELYESYDTIVERLKTRGLEVVGLLSNESVNGSQEEWTANNFEHQGGDGHNSYIDEFGYRFARLAKHFEGKIYYWEIWNEPNAWRNSPEEGVYEGGTFLYPSNFAALLTHAHSQAHYYNNINVHIISGGLFGHDLNGYSEEGAGANYLDKIYDVGINSTGKFAWAKDTYGTYPLDSIGQHIYINQGGVVDQFWFSTYLDYVRSVVTKWEGENSLKKTWVTEFGWQTLEVSEDIQAANLDLSYDAIKNKSYVEAAIWFQLEDIAPINMYYGLYRPDFSEKPSFGIFHDHSIYF